MQKPQLPVSDPTSKHDESLTETAILLFIGKRHTRTQLLPTFELDLRISSDRK